MNHGEPADRDKLSIWFGGIRVAHKGARDPSYDEAAVSAEMKSGASGDAACATVSRRS